MFRNDEVPRHAPRRARAVTDESGTESVDHDARAGASCPEERAHLSRRRSPAPFLTSEAGAVVPFRASGAGTPFRTSGAGAVVPFRTSGAGARFLTCCAGAVVPFRASGAGADIRFLASEAGTDVTFRTSGAGAVVPFRAQMS
ncbi:MAG: hypothetical protein LBT40_15140 [Deltaproteobacteria bacterium]|nr:hypothetical protein [Deltaproteobacteria bacterium]